MEQVVVLTFFSSGLGDSVVVAPSQTLSNEEYHMLRETALKVGFSALRCCVISVIDKIVANTK